VSLAVDHLNRQEHAEGVKRRLDLARGELHRMGRLLDDILLYAKPLSLRLEPVEIGVLVADAVEQQKTLGCDATIDTGSAPEQATAQVLVDRDRIRQVLLNLLKNACEASPAGSMIRVEVGGQGPDRVTISVANPGEPIPPHLRK
jgi:signal transduction histidine kinase